MMPNELAWQPPGSTRRAGRWAGYGLLLAAALTLAGCASSVRLDGQAPVEDRSTTGGTAGDERVGGAGQGAAQGAGPGGDGSVITVRIDAQEWPNGNPSANPSASPRVIYFDFDSFVLRPDARPVVDAQGRRLLNDRQLGLSLQGHTDERGGREYNLALGQKRAEAVQRALQLLGVLPSQLEAVSLGEEQPADTGRGEAAWARNRRVELKDR